MPATVAEWARTERLRRKWTQDEAVAELQRRTGHALSRVWLSHIENGQMPGAETQAALQRLYESEPPSIEEDVQGQLVASMRAQAAAFERLTARVDDLLVAMAPDVRRIAEEAEADVAAFLDAGPLPSAPPLPTRPPKDRTAARS